MGATYAHNGACQFHHEIGRNKMISVKKAQCKQDNPCPGGRPAQGVGQRAAKREGAMAAGARTQLPEGPAEEDDGKNTVALAVPAAVSETGLFAVEEWVIDTGSEKHLVDARHVDPPWRTNSSPTSFRPGARRRGEV